MSETTAPVALFVLANSLSIDAINKKLYQAYSQEMIPGNLHLVSSLKYPIFKGRATDPMVAEGTVPPITQFENPFGGKTVEDAAEWLEKGPESMFLEREMVFVVLDDDSVANDTFTICRKKMWDGVKGGDGTQYEKAVDKEIHFFPHAAGEAGNIVCSILAMVQDFDEYLDMYQSRWKLFSWRNGPDLSRGKALYRR